MINVVTCTCAGKKATSGVVGWCKGVMHFMYAGHPTDIGLQLGKACYPCRR